jgi:alanine racemase
MAAFQRATAMVDLGAVARNCERLRRELAAGSRLCAVVKANGYGHGMLECATAALEGGAEQLAVVAASEAFELRERLPGVPILTMGALTEAELDVALLADSELSVWREGFREVLAERAAALGRVPRVHVKYDTGMGRLGAKDPGEVRALVEAVAADERLELAAVWTHFATADERGSPFLAEQLERFRELAEPLRAEHPGLMLHAANSAATIAEPGAHFDMVRCGVAIYGLDPFGEDAGAEGLEPAMSLISYVADVKRFAPGDTAGYGRRWSAPAETDVGVLPIGYGDGVRRALTNNCDVLVGGRRRPLVGTVSMDNVTIDLGLEGDVEPGADAVLIGAQGTERISAEEWAERLDTINYEITTGISPRVPRVHRR